jgi:flagellar capping protein FliD
MKDQIDDWVEAYNDFATTYNQAKAVENANQVRQ